LDIKKPVSIRADEIQWVKTDEVYPGSSVKILWHDPDTGLICMLIKFPPNTIQGRHVHPSDNHGITLEGEYVVGDRVYGPNTYHYTPANVHHGDEARSGPNGHIAFAVYLSGSGQFEQYLPYFERTLPKGGEDTYGMYPD
jgi:hypothetical protein